MIEKIKETILNIISKNQVTWLWNNQNIDIYDLFLINFSTNVINYKADDCLLNDYTKLISFFNANIEENSNGIDVNSAISNPKENVFNIVTLLYNSIIHKKYRKIKRQFSNYHFTNQELNIMTKIYKLNLKSNKEVIIFNNLNLANTIDSLFIMKMIESGFLSIYASNIKFVIISSSANLNDLDFSRINSDNYYQVTVSEDDMCIYATQKYALGNIDRERIKQYLRLCNNDLKLIALVSESINNNSKETKDYEYIVTLENVIKRVLESMPGLSALEIAAVIGLSFDISTVNEISNYPTNELIVQLNDAYNRGLLIKPTNQEYNFLFISELIRTIIYDSGNINNRWHLNYAKKLSRTLPYEFALIAKHYYLGNNIEQAITNYFAYYIVCTVDDKPINDSDVVIKRILDCINRNITISATFNQIKQYLESYRNNLLNQELTINPLISSLYIDNIVCFVKCMITYHAKLTRSAEAFEKLADSFEKLYNYFDNINCFGLQIRCGLYLIDIYSYRINKISNALFVKQKLDSLTNNILVSQSVENQNLRITLRRKTVSLLSPELASERTKHLLLECISSQQCLDDVEIFKLTNDYLGYSLYSGKYNDIPPQVFNKINEYLILGETLNYPKIYKLQMNYLLYKIYTNQTNFNELKNFLNKSRNDLSTNASMYKFDIAAIALLCNEFSLAETILLELHEELVNNNTCFYNYCYNANLSALYFLKKDYKKAKYYNNLIAANNYEWEQDFIEIMKYRANKMNEFIEQEFSFDSKALFDCFDNSELICSSVWRFLGKGIIFSELMFYRE